ncbi:MAG: flagellar biosynthesis anti-sigma factor FlgM [Burkholderiales bacterium]|nr:flagellar biosynthesis anti-sigma factor FlgM [Burkholderiales bacterium]
MKINNSIGKPTGVSAPQDAISGKPVGPTPAPSRTSSDRVAITSLSSQLQALESRLADVSVVDVARVSAIKQAISEGRFNVDSEVVADRLIATVREYLLSQKG